MRETADSLPFGAGEWQGCVKHPVSDGTPSAEEFFEVFSQM